MRPRLAVVLLALALALTSCFERGVKVSRAEYGDDWPLTVESGRLRCRPPWVITFHTGDEAYAVNGMARSRGYRDIRPIWRDNPDLPGTKIPITPLITRGRAYCG